MIEEKWKPVAGYPGYFVSNHGKVRGKRGTILKRQYGDRGGNYPFVNMYRKQNGKSKRKNANIHGLVAAAFIGPLPKGMVVHHEDGNRDNCNVTNLEHVTHAVNAQLKIRNKS